jgi:hypothetical protein
MVGINQIRSTYMTHLHHDANVDFGFNQTSLFALLGLGEVPLDGRRGDLTINFTGNFNDQSY